MMEQNINQDFIELVQNYVETKETDYALCLDGPWGSGKSYFINNILKKSVAEVSYDDGKKFGLLVVSLFGICEPTEIQERLFFELNPLLKSKPAILLSSVARRLPWVSSIKTEWVNKKEKTDIISLFGIPKNKILVFDDFERQGEDSFKRTIGWLNQLIEKEKLKVIIVGDFSKKSIDQIIESKEKIIRHTFLFKADINAFIKHYCEIEVPKFKDVLVNHSNQIQEILTSASHCNLRTLKFYIDVLKLILPHVKIQENSKVKNELIDRLILSTLMLCIEYKKGKTEDLIALKTFDGFSQMNFNLGEIAKAFSTPEKNTVEPTNPMQEFFKRFQKDYLDNGKHTFIFLEEIVKLIITGKLNVPNFEIELQKKVPIIRNQILSESGILIKKFSSFYDLEDSEFRELFSQITEKVRNSEFMIMDYANIFSTLVILDREKIIELNEELVNQYLNAVRNSVDHSEYIDSISSRFSQLTDKDDRYESLKKLIVQSNQEIFNRQTKKLAEELIILFEENRMEDIQISFKDESMMMRDLFNWIDPSQFFGILLHQSNADLFNFRDILYVRYRHQHLPTSLKGEEEFFLQLSKIIDNHLDQSLETTIQLRILHHLNNELKRIAGLKLY